MDKSYRIHTNISRDTVLNVNMQQDYDFLEVLSLKLRQKDAYKLHSSNYGVIIGRVLANDAFGIPNARISVFIERDSGDTTFMESIYPYTEVTSKDKEGRRYNLLPDSSDDDCYRIVGTFPNKRLVLDDDTYLEIFDKYWKYSTVTNNAGDYMIFGVPSGSQQIHVDLDLSDIGILSQKPRDFEYKGYNVTMFDNPSQFKESTNLDSLAQIFSQNKSVFVYPFWGDADNGIAAITRSDIEIQYKFEPTCVFMGSIVSDNEANSIGHKCAPSVDNGMNDQLVAGQGTIEMIRKTTDGLVEEFQIQGNQLIDEDGVWCYQIPMNLDYVGTDEYGNITPTDNPNRGIPTRTQVRFRISKNETGDEGFSRHTAKYLVPMNPIFDEDKSIPTIKNNGQDIERMYAFGSSTPQSCFRDLYWNNVYSVKNYIPKVQVAHRPYSKNYSALKGSNLAEDQNPIPFNKLRVDIPFMYMIVCILFTVVMWIVSFVNLLICMVNKIFSIFNTIHDIRIPVIRVRPFSWIPSIPYIGCVSLGGGLSEDNTAYYPSCECKEGLNASDCPSDMEGNCKKRSSNGALMDLVQQRLAEDYKIIKLDLYQDWINGCLYMPLWFWRKRKKKTFLFFTLSSAKNEYCSCDKTYSRLKTYVTCNVKYRDNSFRVSSSDVDEKENDWHRSTRRASQVRYKNGIIKEVENNDGLKVYYYTALQATTNNDDPNLAMDKRTKPFRAVRLYATDIILLGNLNENNLYGIPQFFKALPSTTANIPPIATIEEEVESDENVENYSQNEISGGEDSGNTVTTGMDWGRNSDGDSPQYKNGLFMDLACTYAHTKAKSCFNVERLSELGVNLDMTYNMSYAHNGNGIKSGIIDSDGFITKYELDDMENRAMFATMNHIGFVPQDYQDSISGYTTQVEDANTNYLVPKFKYIYPVDFDGRMSILMDRYKNGFNQATFDEADEAYMTFRMGAENGRGSNRNREFNRIRHFYYGNGSDYEMPLYNNSYYFYFGAKKGSTAIDKFNKLFYSECYQNSKKPFSYEVNVKGKTYCTDLYNCHSKQEWISDDSLEGGGEWRNYEDTSIVNNRGYGYIRFTSDDIRTPFSYVLYDSNGAEVIRERDMYDTDFVIGGTLNDEGEVIHNVNGAVQYHDEEANPVDNEYGTNGLTNQVYVLEITDADGNKQSERVKVEMDKISFEYVAQKLGTKFYNTDVTRIDYICNDDTDFYGILEITKFYIDSYEYRITSVDVLTPSSTSSENEEKYQIRVKGEPVSKDAPICKVDNENFYVLFELYAVNNEISVRDCMCDKGNSIPHKEGIYIERHKDGASDFFYFDSATNSFKFYVYQPDSFIGKIVQVCNMEELEENSTTEIIKIQNGKNFNTFLNTMPTRFIIGTTSDGANAEIGNTSKFYRSEYKTEKPIDSGIGGWFGVHQEDTYQFGLNINTTVPRNRDIWSDFITIGNDITDVDTRKNILRYKFDKMFRVSDTTYLTTSNNNTFRYTAEGGVEPILYRSVVPFYSNYNMMFNTYIYGDNNYISSVEEYPQVVGSNYHEAGRRGPYLNRADNEIDADNNIDTDSPRFNKKYIDCTTSLDGTDYNFTGNYFAAFTKNGRYTTTTSGDCSTSIVALPNYAAVNLESGWKRLGRDLQKTITNLSKVYKSDTSDGECSGKKTQPYLRTLYVDRRLDYDFIMWGPSMGVDMRLHSSIDKEMPWKSARISGWTYGGIEMSYDEEYNIISATSVPYYTVPDVDEYTRYTTSDAAFAATEDQLKVLHPKEEDESDAEWTVRLKKCVVENDDNKKPNNRLEYSYYVDGNENSNAYTVYNEPENGKVAWVDRRDTNAHELYDKNVDNDPSKQYIKTLYESTINELDVRQLYWSTFNFERLKHYVNTTQQSGVQAFESHRNYVFLHDNIYYGFNGDFNYNNRSDYPTKRLIDIGNIRPQEDYMITMASCSYGINPEVTEDGDVKCYVEAGENVELNLQFSNPVEFIAPNADSKDYANAIMVKQSNGEASNYDGSNIYAKFEVEKIDLDFRLTKVTSNDFEVYTERPLLIKVLDSVFNEHGNKHTDAITYIKAASDELLYDGGNMPFAVDECIQNVGGRIGEVLLYEFKFCNVRSSLKTLEDTFPSNREVDIWWQSGSSPFYTKGGKKNDEFVSSDDNDFYNIEFRKSLGIDKDIYAFTVLVLRTYKGSDTEYLTRRIRTIETSSIYDTRRMLLKVVDKVNADPADPDSGEKATYVIKSSAGTNVDVTVDTKIPTEPEGDDEGGGDEGGGDEGGGEQEKSYSGSGSGTVETQIHTQVITFQMLNKCDYSEGAEKLTNQSLADYDMMSFTFKFTDKHNNYYYLTPEVSVDTDIQKDCTTESDPRTGQVVEICEEKEVKINFKLIFSQDMGILADSQWSEGAKVTVFAKTKDNFTYKLSDFWLSSINYINPQNESGGGDYDAVNKISLDKDKEEGGRTIKAVEVFDGTDETKYITNVQID